MSQIAIHYTTVKDIGRQVCEPAEHLDGMARRLGELASVSGDPGFRVDAALAAVCGDAASSIRTARQRLGDTGEQIYRSGLEFEQLEESNVALASADGKARS